MKILVVDDEKFNLTIAKAYLDEVFGASADVILCSEPRQVPELLSAGDVDILLLDIMMPEITGIELLKAIRSSLEYDSLQIIMLTSMSDNESFRQCFEAGADDYIRKPIHPVEFSARIKAAAKSAISIRQLRDTQFHLLQKEKLASIGGLAAGIAHEINNPVGYVGSNLETMGAFLDRILSMVQHYRAFIDELEADGSAPRSVQDNIRKLRSAETKTKLDFVLEELKGIIKDSRQGIDKVAKIVQSLKSFASTGLEDEPLFNDLNQILEEALLIVNNEAKYTIDINKTLGDIPPVMCSRNQIGQVALNLLLNAIQAIRSQKRKDRGHICVETFSVGSEVCCRITDDGPGIPVGNRDRIFDPFFTSKDVGQGTGLGLTIAYDIITNKHHGSLSFACSNEGGTSFLLRLPLDGCEAGQAEGCL